MPEELKTEKFNITGMTCAACQANVTRCVRKQPGVRDVNVSLLSNQMSVTYDGAALSGDAIVRAVEGIGYGASPAESAAPKQNGFRGAWEARARRAEEERRDMKRRLIFSAALLVPLMYLAMGGMLSWPLPAFLTGEENRLPAALTQFFIALPILLIHRRFFENGLRALAKRAPNMDTLVAVGSGASLLYGIFALYRMSYGLGHGDAALVHQYAHALYFESSAMVPTLVTVGKYLEARSKTRTSDALDKLVDLAPRTASVIREGRETVIPSEQVAAGDIVVIRPGGSIPVDGVVTEGSGYVDESAITGESLPVEKKTGDEVISATLNQNGSFRFRASRVGEDTTLAQIIRMVDEAGNSKAPIARLADRVSGVFVPVVIGIAALTLCVWLLAGQSFEFALNCAVSVLVISCPCALGLATPVAIMVGTGKAAEYGILIKSASSLELLHAVDTVALDKTGTLTSGRPSVTDVVPLQPGLTEEALLRTAAGAEAGSEHPLAAAVVRRAAEAGLTPPPAQDFQIAAGRGVRSVLESETVLAGNADYLGENGIDVSPALPALSRLAGEGKTPLLFARGGALLGVIAVADTVRPDSRRAVRALQDMGIRTVMLTGDNPLTAEAIRAQVGVDETVAGVRPAEKAAAVRRLQAEGRRVAMVGDGINDAPALTAADVGIAIGAGTDIAIDSADVVLMKSSLADAVTAVRLSRAVVRNIRQDLFWAFFYNILGIPVAAGVLYPAFGLLLSPMIGAAAMSLSSVCVVTNALRLRLFRAEPAPAEEAASAPAPAPEAPAPSGGTVAVLDVEGMMCDHCRAHVQSALEAVPGVTAVQVDLAAKTASVTLAEDVPDSALADAVSAAGYTPGHCVRTKSSAN